MISKMVNILISASSEISCLYNEVVSLPMPLQARVFCAFQKKNYWRIKKVLQSLIYKDTSQIRPSERKFSLSRAPECRHPVKFLIMLCNVPGRRNPKLQPGYQENRQFPWQLPLVYTLFALVGKAPLGYSDASFRWSG